MAIDESQNSMSGYHTDKYISENIIDKNSRPTAEGISLASTGKKTCPVCDTPVPEDARKCPSCDTDLTLFDIDMDGELDVDKIEISDEKAIDDILSSIVGKDESSKLLEDIREIGKEADVNDEANEEAAETSVVEPEAAEETKLEEIREFECPSCGTIVGEDETKCPECGVEFAEQEVLEFECPVCNASVSSTASSCGNCGVKFEAPEEEEEPEKVAGEPVAEPAPEPEVEPSPEPEVEPDEVPTPEPPEEAPPSPPPKEEVPTLSERLIAERKEKLNENPPDSYEGKDMYKVLPALVNEIKPILAIAKKQGINIGPSKELIGRAVAANKAGQIENAVNIIQSARISLDDSMTMEIANDIEGFVNEIKQAKEVGCEVAGSEELVREAITALREEDYEVAISDLEAAINELQRSAGSYREASQALDEANELMKNASALGIDTEESLGLLAEGREAVNRKGWETAALFAKKAMDEVAKTLPEVLMEEMKMAKDSLLELKMKGGDLRKPMGIYKQASIAMKKEDYSDALRYLRSFKKEVGS
jgi:tetratricopeptide (TPR) repeat protein